MKKIFLLVSVSVMGLFVTAQDQYSYTAPQDWQAEKGNEYMRYVQPPSATGQSCVMTIIAPQASSGDLETDVKNVFGMMYPGWNFYYSDARRDEMTKGVTKQGLEYCMMEGAMMRERAGGGWDYETGAALVIGFGKQIAIVSLRHERVGLDCKCKHRYDYWGTVTNRPRLLPELRPFFLGDLEMTTPPGFTPMTRWGCTRTSRAGSRPTCVSTQSLPAPATMGLLKTRWQSDLAPPTGQLRLAGPSRTRRWPAATRASTRSCRGHTQKWDSKTPFFRVNSSQFVPVSIDRLLDRICAADRIN